MTSAESLWRELRALGVVLSIDEHGRLTYDAPDGVLAGDAIDRIKNHRDALLGMLKGDAGKERSEVADGGPEPMPPGWICPWCRGRRLVDNHRGCRCWNCGRQAWVFVGRSIVRADCVGIDLREWPETRDRGLGR